MLDHVKVAAIVFVAAVLQVAVFTDAVVLGGAPDVLLVTLVALALLRGSVVGALAGFFGGLIVDVTTLGLLGLSSLVLTLVGYWAGRFSETVALGRRYAPYVAVAAMTLLYPCGVLAVRFLLGEPAPVRAVLFDTFLQTLTLNLLVTWPVYALVRRALPDHAPATMTLGAKAIG